MVFSDDDNVTAGPLNSGSAELRDAFFLTARHEIDPGKTFSNESGRGVPTAVDYDHFRLYLASLPA